MAACKKCGKELTRCWQTICDGCLAGELLKHQLPAPIMVRGNAMLKLMELFNGF